MVEDEIANLNKNDIIKAEGVSKLEQAKKRDHKIYITDIAINKVPLAKIDGFTEEQNIKLQQKHKELLKISQTENNSNEVASVFGLDFSENEIQMGNENCVKLSSNPIICDMILRSEEKTVFVAHNHPSTQKFSYSDFAVILSNDSVLGISVVTNTGEVHILSKNAEYSYNKSIELLRKIKNDNKTEKGFDDKKVVDEFLKYSKNVGLKYIKGGGKYVK